MSATDATVSRACPMCSVEVTGHANRVYCSSRCQNKNRDLRRGVACSACAAPMYLARVMAEVPLCQPCRRARPGYRDRVKASQDQHWICQACGVECSRPAMKGQRPKWCSPCARAVSHRDIKISPSERIAVYEKDCWVCWLCESPVDRLLIGSRSHWRPSLDHVRPHSQGGSDDPSNLRLAHWWCNAARSDGRTYSPEDFRVAS